MQRSYPLRAALVLSALAGCAPPDTPAEDGTRLGRPRLVITRLSPPVGPFVDSTTVIEATLRYVIPDSVAYPGPYLAGLSFRTSDRSSFRPATPEERAANAVAGRASSIE